MEPTLRSFERSRPAPRLHVALHARGDVGGAGAEAGHARPLGEVPEHAQVGVPGAAVVEHDLGRREQHAHQEVPHHPAGGGEPEDAVALLGVEVQVQLLEVLQQDAALRVHDRLRQAGGARGVEHPQRVIEGQPRELRLGSGVAGERRGPAVAAEVAELDHLHPAPDLLRDAGHHLAAVEVLAVVAVAVHRQQHLRLDLGEAVDHRARAEVRRAARPHRPDRRAGEERGDRLRDVRHVRHHAVAGPDPVGAQPGRDPRGHPLQLAPAHRVELAQLGGVVDRRGRVVLAAEDVLGVGQRGAGEPLRAGHLRASRARSTYPASLWTSKNSQIEAQNASRSSVDQRHSAS